MVEPKVLLVDGMALLFRAYYASALSGYIQKTSYGLPTNAVNGFVRYLLDAVQIFDPSHVICCWDMGSTTFRTEMYSEYKANRGEPPEELIPQFNLVREVTDAFNIRSVGVPGWEADDCIGTLAQSLAGSGSGRAKVYILTGDHDMLQLIEDDIKVVIMKKGLSNYAVFDRELLLAEKGLSPKQVVDIKGLMGDTADNYPGVRGIGEKTALKLLQEYESIEGILDKLTELPKGIRGKIEAELDMLHLSRDLARIRCDAPIACTLDECLWAPDPKQVLQKFDELEFKGLKKLIG
jgi:5'-3' exonuclease